MDTKDRDELNAYTGANRTQHTPGPWREEEEYISAERKGKTGEYVIRGHMDVFVCKVRGEDDARLIAAAPELLRSLIFLLNCCEMNMDDMEPESLAAIEEAKAAISRATGRE